MTASPDSITRAKPPRLALTMGDPAGIGLELAVKTWLAAQSSASAPPYSLVLYADPDAVASTAASAGVADPVAVISDPHAAAEVWPRKLPVIPVPLARPVTPGRPDTANAAAVIRSIELATEVVVRGDAAALVTNPIAKHVLYGAGFSHPGHTEFLAELAARFVGGGPWLPVMMLASDELRVVPLTIHIPLADVPGALTRELIVDTTRIVATSLTHDFGLGQHPRIAVAGLNPHAGENGTIGTEDQHIIGPAIAALREEGLAVTGPHSADTLFHAAARATYDAVIAMYHDQALIPIKTLAFDRGVNVTLGLPFVRTSPDHGTAFDIAGTNAANPTSLQEALLLAARLAANRATATSQ